MHWTSSRRKTKPRSPCTTSDVCRVGGRALAFSPDFIGDTHSGTNFFPPACGTAGGIYSPDWSTLELPAQFRHVDAAPASLAEVRALRRKCGVQNLDAARLEELD